MYTFFVIVHLTVSLVLILVVLLQSGKAGDLASAFGGAGSQTAFGTRSAATFLSKATTICAVVFMVTSLGLSIMSFQTSGTIMQDAPPVTATEESPAVPVTPPAEEGGSQNQQQSAEPPGEEPPGN